MREVNEYRQAWIEFSLAVQELIDAVRMLLPEVVRIPYWVCQQTDGHIFDFDDWRLLWGGDHWRTQGKTVCPKCAGILEQRIAKVSKR